jgi:glutathione synthase/RimK-type ligase-like ATP-grasp enzyme
LTSLGIIVLNIAQEQHYFTSLGEMAHSYNIKLYRFKPESIDFSIECITGESYDRNRGWVHAAFPFPDYIYDRCFYRSNEEVKFYQPVMKKVKSNRHSTFIGNGLPNKWKVHEALASDREMTAFLPKTLKIESVQQLKTHLEHAEFTTPVLLKPVHGSQGNGIVRINSYHDHVSAQVNMQGKMKQMQFQSKSSFFKWIQRYIKTRNVLIQPFLTLQNDEGRPFDIRILLQKDHKGDWVERGRGTRVGKRDTFISNLHSGGQIEDYDNWMNTHFSLKRIDIEHKIRHILSRTPQLLEQQFQPLFELGMDIGVDREGKVWIIEVNSKPGHQVVLNTKHYGNEIYNAPFQYCLYLYKELSTNA